MRLGFSSLGLLYLLMLILPNLLWLKHKPKDYDAYVHTENKVLLLFERVGEVAVTCIALICRDFQPSKLSLWSLWLLASFLLMSMYELFWLSYFTSEKTMRDFYRPFCGVPVAGATLPVLAFFCLGIYGKNLYMLFAVILLGIGHIGIHDQHYKEIR